MGINRAIYVALILGWAISIFLLSVLITALVRIDDKVTHFAYTWLANPDIPYQLEASEVGQLSAELHDYFEKNIADYLFDQMGRYMRYYTQETKDYVLRSNTRVQELIYTEGGKELSCVVLEATIEDKGPKVGVVLFKGTTTAYELLDVDLVYRQDKLTFSTRQSARHAIPSWMLKSNAPGLMVHDGFQRFYGEMRECIFAALKKISPHAVYVCGHSLGGAMATLCGWDLVENGFESYTVTAGCPRVGNLIFAQYLDGKKMRLFNLRNLTDVIPTCPWAQTPSISGHNELFQFTHAGMGLQFCELGSNQSYCHSLGAYQRNTSELKPIFEFKRDI
jgi:Lipase (class 3)